MGKGIPFCFKANLLSSKTVAKLHDAMILNTRLKMINISEEKFRKFIAELCVRMTCIL